MAGARNQTEFSQNKRPQEVETAGEASPTEATAEKFAARIPSAATKLPATTKERIGGWWLPCMFGSFRKLHR
jgi:hypothetical protein